MVQYTEECDFYLAESKMRSMIVLLSSEILPKPLDAPIAEIIAESTMFPSLLQINVMTIIYHCF